jgi:hypothetical protein
MPLPALVDFQTYLTLTECHRPLYEITLDSDMSLTRMDTGDS